MADVVDRATRSRMMSGIRGKDTKPELLIRRGLHAKGFRYRVHCKGVPGNPDICIRNRKAAIFVHGCFWHLHECRLFKWPSTRPEFWRNKIEANRSRDEAALRELAAAGWRSLVIWECALKGVTRVPVDLVVDECAEWLRTGVGDLEIGG